MRRMKPNLVEFLADINNQNWNRLDELLKEFGSELVKLESRVKLVIVRRLVKDFYKDLEALSRDIEKAKQSNVVGKRARHIPRNLAPGNNNNNEEKNHVIDEVIAINPLISMHENSHLLKKQKFERSCPAAVVPKDGPDPPPDLSTNFRERIEARGGSDVALIIQKKLYKLDVSSNHNRMSIPASQVRSEFLKPEEEAWVCSRDASGKMKHIEAVPMIGPSSPHHECRIGLAKWKMEKGEGRNSSWTYNLVTTWNSVVQDNNLKQDMIVQVWSYRVDDRLHFALVRLGESGRNISTR